jgi:single-strand DNA-binding protein
LAINRRWKGQNGEDREETTFVDCSAFAKTAEVINQYFTKGKPIFIEGRLKFDSWEDKQGGGKRSRLTVVVENFQFIGGRDGGQGGGGGGGGARSVEGDDQRAERAAPQRAGGGQGRPAPEAPFDDSQQFKDEDIPF